MHSTDTNIDHPYKGSLISSMPDSLGLTAVSVSQKFYDLTLKHDPKTIYIIEDDPKGKMYIGDVLIDESHEPVQYVVGYHSLTKEYTVYRVIHTRFNSQLKSLKRYKKPQDAIDAIQKYEKTGSEDKLHMSIYIALTAYIVKDNGIHDTIMSILMNSFGYKEYPGIQDILSLAINTGVNNGDRDITDQFKAILAERDQVSQYPFCYLYQKVYDVFVKYDFFKGKAYQCDPEDLVLSEPIEDIIHIYISECFKGFDNNVKR